AGYPQGDSRMTESATPKARDNESRFTLTATGPSARGQVAALTRFVDEQNGYIEAYDQYNDPVTQKFFSRVVFRTYHAADATDELTDMVRPVADRFGMDILIQSELDRPKVLIMVSKTDHCLRDLLYRHRRGELPMEITAVASNHDDLRSLAEQHGLRYVHLPVDSSNRAEQEQQINDLIA